MVTSAFDLFKIGVGPSSSHTMGPMTAARPFVEGLRNRRLPHGIATVAAGSKIEARVHHSIDGGAGWR